MTTATLENTDTMTMTNTNNGEQMNLGDIPDLSSLATSGNSWEDGWYASEILGRREFEDKNGNTRLFESGDGVAASGTSRNIRLQVKLTRASDNKVMHLSTLINYRPEDLTSENVQLIIADSAKADSDRDKTLTRSRLTLARIASLQKIADVRSFQRTEDGGLNLEPLYGKSCYARIKDDDRNPAYKAIADFRFDRPTKAKVL